MQMSPDEVGALQRLVGYFISREQFDDNIRAAVETEVGSDKPDRVAEVVRKLEVFAPSI